MYIYLFSIQVYTVNTVYTLSSIYYLFVIWLACLATSLQRRGDIILYSLITRVIIKDVLLLLCYNIIISYYFQGLNEKMLLRPGAVVRRAR